MSFVEAREMIRIRHELRTLLARAARTEAQPLLQRLHETAARDPVEYAQVLPELQRWRCAFGLLD